MSIRLQKKSDKVESFKAIRNKEFKRSLLQLSQKHYSKQRMKHQKKFKKEAAFKDQGKKNSSKYKSYFADSAKEEASLKSSFNYLDGSRSHHKPMYATRKPSHLCSPINLLQSQYKLMSEGKMTWKKRKKAKSKKCRSSVWLKSNPIQISGKNIDINLKLLMNSRYAQRREINRKHNKTVHKFSDNIKIKKMCNNDDLILNGENMLDNSYSQMRTEDNTNNNKGFLESQENTLKNSLSPNLHHSASNSRKNIRSNTLSYQEDSKYDHFGSSKNSSYALNPSLDQLNAQRRKNFEILKDRKKSKDASISNHKLLCKPKDLTFSPKTKRYNKRKMLVPKFFGVTKSPELPIRHQRLLKPRSKSSKSKNSKRYALTNIGNGNQKDENCLKRTHRKAFRKSFDMCLQDFKHYQNHTPKDTAKLLYSMSFGKRQKSSANISLLKKSKRIQKNNSKY
ncbi:unnamed protein product [Moneuplotes crassus]|uniref:Uncharacterized protein n=1 Tax=Euplotes crassus TaxID=5936 RepID=A0AAD1XDD5_EUPCR|nr:unnamed protein product [Moneuplotes crassus]